MKSEYKILRTSKEDELEREVNNLSADGWELVNVAVGGNLGGAIFIAAMKRQTG